MTYNKLSEEELKVITDLQAEIVQRENAVREAQAEAAAQKTKLGEYFWKKHEQGDSFDEDAEEIVSKIEAVISSIASITTDIEALQNENARRSEEMKRLAEEAARKQEEAAAALAAANAMKNITSNADASGVLCKKCGSILFKDAKFCAECGMPVPKDEPKAEQASVCKRCGAQLEEGARFCAECGTPIVVVARATVVERKCSKCGAKLDSEARFCADCGTPA